jgi:hypothetical protein
MSYYGLFYKLASPNKENGKSRIVYTDEFVGEYEKLKLGNGGSWCRFDTSKLSKNFNIVKYYANGKIDKNFEMDQKIECVFTTNSRNQIIALQLFGYKTSPSMSRYIPKNIREYYKEQNCVVCGNKNVEIDHKDYFYRHLKEQTIQDFQPLCKHCNDQKRSDIKKYKNYHQCPPLLSFFVMTDFINTNIKLTFWYDPIQYTKNIFKTYFLYWIKPLIYEYFDQCQNGNEFFEIIKEKIEKI